MLETRELTIEFNRSGKTFTAVDKVSMTVTQGSSFGLVGESGSGKSTILRALSGFMRASSGDILVGGSTLKNPEKSFFKQVQMIFQDPFGSLNPAHRIGRILDEPLRLHSFDNRADRIRRALVDVGLPETAQSRYPHELSGGQRQRVAIARALIMEPQVILLDEPTSALDVSVQAEVLNLLDRLRTERGLTYVLVSHDLAVVAHLCDEIGVMQDGKMVETITVDNLLAGEAKHPYTQHLLAIALKNDLVFDENQLSR
ncbi:ABC transporter ATP-binding protein [Rhizobium sp. 18055]|jgi:peptide/nickel transport system ATP-binding protein|uniref:ABC transporter ATP-binding protein n=1 Tax=Rhizobium sp. 18055 TaxID=2681403 RepID=UPI0013574D8D|nr:ABC transporter ATP-binding protein [Rhizobium sp. 18055]